MHNVVNNLISIENELKIKIKKLNIENYSPKIIAVSKTFPKKDILPLINHSHIHFGENKVQEALEKWTDIKNDFTKIKLHMVGRLQTNKVKYAIPLFDYIHSLDNLKLAEKISNEQVKKNKIIKFKYQINACLYCQASISLLSKLSKNKQLESVKNFLNQASILFDKKKELKSWNKFEKIFNKKNNARKECLLLPLKTMFKALNN